MVGSKNLENHNLDLSNLEKLINSDDYKKLSEQQLENLHNKIERHIKKKAYARFCEYNVKDTRLVAGINTKMKFISHALTVAHMSKSRVQEVFATVKPWDNLLYNMLLTRNVQPPPEKIGSKSEAFIGAFVKDPNPGRYLWVLSFDLTSLYPSIIRMLNMSLETIIDSQVEDVLAYMESLLSGELDTSFAKHANVILCANGTTYVRDKQGIIPEAMTYLFEERKAVKKLMKVRERELNAFKLQYEENNDPTLNIKIKELDDEISMLDAKQQALKILTNGGYGAIGNVAFRYYREEIAEGITVTGQLAIRYIANMINKFLNEKCNTSGVDYVCGIDTDSNYLVLNQWVLDNLDQSKLTKNEIVDALDKFATEEIEPYISDKYQALAEYLNAPVNYLDMKREAIADIAMWRAKKNYIIQVYDNEHVRYAHPKLKMMGIETARTSTAMMTRNALKESINLIINGTSDELVEYVKCYKEKFMSEPVERIASPRGVNGIDKWTDDNYDTISKTPFHVKGAVAYNKLVMNDPVLKRKYELIKNGNKIKLIPLKKENPLHTNYIGFIDILPEEFELDEYVDREIHWEKTYIGPVKSFSDLLHWDIDRKPSLNDLFEESDNSEYLQFIPKPKQKPSQKVSLDSWFD